MSDHRPETYQTLDAWRGLACLAVVAFHIASEQGGRGAFAWAGYGYLGVQVFFVVSGYCIASAAIGTWRRGRSTGSFALARLRRIYPPMLWSLGFYAAVKIALSLLVSRGVIAGGQPAVDLLSQSPLFYLANLTLTQEVFHTAYWSRVTWSLCYEIAFYAIVGVALVTLRRRSRREGALLDVLHALTAVTLALLLFFPQARCYPLDLWPQFGFGVLVFDLGHRRARWWMALLALEWAVFLFARDFPVSQVNTSSRLGFAVAGMAAAGLVLLRPLDRRLARWPGAGWLMAAGRFSYSTYLIHYLIISSLVKLLPRVPGLGASTLASGLFMAAAAVVGGYGFYWLFERPCVTRKGASVVAPPATSVAPPLPL